MSRFPPGKRFIYKCSFPRNSECKLSFIAPGSNEQQSINVFIPETSEWETVAWQPDFGDFAQLPVKSLEELFKGESLAQNFSMGIDATNGFLTQTYMTIKGMLTGECQYEGRQWSYWHPGDELYYRLYQTNRILCIYDGNA